MKHYKHIIIILFIFLFFSSSEQSIAGDTQPPELQNIIVTTSDTHLIVFAKVINCFTPEMINGVKNGIPIRFIFHIKLIKIRPNWFDSTLVNGEVTHTMTYDSLKQEYKIEKSERGQNRTAISKSLQEAKQIMDRLDEGRVTSHLKLQPDAPYRLRLKVTLEKSTLPFGMHTYIPLTSLWDFETSWRSVEFRY